MNIYLISILLILFSACQEKGNDAVYGVIKTILEDEADEDYINLIRNTNTDWNRNSKVDFCSLEGIDRLQTDSSTDSQVAKISSLLTEDDLISMCKQNDISIVLDPKNLPKNVRIYPKKVLLDYELDYASPTFHEFSTPMFNSKQTYALVYVAEYCGPECGGGGLYFLENKHGKWEKIAYVMLWIS
jgi:hypothetical protein